MGMTTIVVEIFSYSCSKSSSNNYSKAFKNPHFGEIWSDGPIKILETRQISTKIAPNVKYIFLVGSFLTPFGPFYIKHGVSMSV